MNYLQRQATDERPIAVLTRKKGYIRMDVYFAEGDADILDANTTDFDEALKKLLKDYEAEEAEIVSEIDMTGPTGHPGQRAWKLKMKSE